MRHVFVDLSMFLGASLGALFLLATHPATAASQVCPPAKTALVLGGGGAKGFAHVGVIEALDSAGIRPDLIVGTSIGAIIGALYASGYSGRQIDSLARVYPIDRLIHAYVPVVPSVLQDITDPVLPAVVWEVRDRKFRLQTGAVQEGEVSALMSALMLRGNLIARGSFDSLPIPFRAIATDLRTRKPVILERGDLAEVVRASFAIPVVFRPIRIDDRELTDGGVSANVPVDIARQLGAERVIVSTVPGDTTPLRDYDRPETVAQQLFDYVFVDGDWTLWPDDVLIRNRTTTFAILDFSTKATDSLIARGYQDATRILAQARCLRPLGLARTVPTTFVMGTIESPVLTGAEERAIANFFHLRTNQPIPENFMRRRLKEVGEIGVFDAVWLTPTRVPGNNDMVSFAPHGTRVAPQAAGLAVAYDHDNSWRVWMGYADRSFRNRNTQGGATLRLGRFQQSLEAGFQANTRAVGRTPPFFLRASIAHEDVRVFAGDAELPGLDTRDAAVFAGILWYSWAKSRGRASLVYRGWKWESHIGPESESHSGRAVGVRAEIARHGPLAATVDAEINGSFQTFELSSSRVFRVGRYQIRPSMQLAFGNNLPPEHGYVFGGDEGFPGFTTGALRGEQVIVVRVSADRKIAGPLLLSGELAAGYDNESDDFFFQNQPGSGRVLAGARLGIGLNTPIGVIRAQEGRNSLGERALYVRIGQWF